MQSNKSSHLEFSFDKKILDQLDRKQKSKPSKSPSKKIVDFSRASQFKSRKKNLNYSLTPGKPSSEDYPSAFNIRRKMNEKRTDSKNAPAYTTLLYNLHTVHTNLLSFLTTERENMTQKPTFQPKITFKGKQMFEGTGKTVSERSEAWIDRKKDRLEKLKQETGKIREEELKQIMRPHKPLIYKDKPDVTSKVHVYTRSPVVDFSRIGKKMADREEGDQVLDGNGAYLGSTGELKTFIRNNFK